MKSPSGTWITSGSKTHRLSLGQQSGACGSTTGSSAHSHSPVGPPLVAAAIADPPPGKVVLVTVTYRMYLSLASSYSISGAHNPASAVAHEGLLVNASPTYVQCTRSVDRSCGTRRKLNPVSVRSSSLSGSVVQYMYQYPSSAGSWPRITDGSAQLSTRPSPGTVSVSGFSYVPDPAATGLAPTSAATSTTTGTRIRRTRAVDRRAGRAGIGFLRARRQTATSSHSVCNGGCGEPPGGRTWR